MAPMMLPIILGAVTITAVAALAIEASRHGRRLGTVQHRVHVNGTRGKTEVTELIGAAMGNAGIRTWTKTTGKSTRAVDHRGRAVPFGRAGPPNVREQMEFMQRASDAGARGVAVECMAITPELQQTSTRMVRPTIGVITNVRLEHTDVMGPGLDDVAEALAGTIPENGVLVTGDRRYHRYFREIGRVRGTVTVLADRRRLPEDLRAAFADHPHIENVAIAWSVCRSMGIDEGPLMQAWSSRGTPATGLEFNGTSIIFIDALGANDAESTRMALDGAGPDNDRPIVGLFIGRADRPGRAVEMAERFLPDAGFDRCFAVGPGARLFAARSRDAVEVLRTTDPEKVVDEIVQAIDGDLTLFAFGNRTGRTATGFLGSIASEACE